MIIKLYGSIEIFVFCVLRFADCVQHAEQNHANVNLSFIVTARNSEYERRGYAATFGCLCKFDR
jgi:hypothetical protein